MLDFQFDVKLKSKFLHLNDIITWSAKVCIDRCVKQGKLSSLLILYLINKMVMLAFLKLNVIFLKVMSRKITNLTQMKRTFYQNSKMTA